jgi:hypothetical protein
LLKRECGKKHKIQLAKFDRPSLRVIGFRWAPLLRCQHIEMSRPRAPETTACWCGRASGYKTRARSVVCDAHERIVRCGLVIVPVTSQTEDKFEDAMEVRAGSPLLEIAGVLIRLHHVTRIIVKANHGMLVSLPGAIR